VQHDEAALRPAEAFDECLDRRQRKPSRARLAAALEVDQTFQKARRITGRRDDGRSAGRRMTLALDLVASSAPSGA
jgi:hypothetical protein